MQTVQLSDDRPITDLERQIIENREYVLVQCRRWLARYPLGNEIAEELTQETMLKACKNQDRFRGTAKVRTWLYQIAQNLVRDYLRQQGRRGIECSIDVAFADSIEPEAHAPDPTDRLFIQQVFARQTPTVQRTMAHMLGNLSQRDTATATGFRYERVKSQVFRFYKQAQKLAHLPA